MIKHQDSLSESDSKGEDVDRPKRKKGKDKEKEKEKGDQKEKGLSIGQEKKGGKEPLYPVLEDKFSAERSGGPVAPLGPCSISAPPPYPPMGEGSNFIKRETWKRLASAFPVFENCP